MEIKKIMNEFIEESKEKLDLSCILQFGSSTYTDDFEDIDLLFLSSHNVIPTKQNLELIRIVKDFENRYDDIVFDFGGVGTRDKEAKHSITVVYLNKEHLNLEHNPHDLFFFKLLSEDKNIKTLYGVNPFEKMEINFTKQHLLEMLSVDLKRDILRNSLDDENKLNEGLYCFFKGALRAMLIHKGHFKKEELLNEFQKEYGNKIRLPGNSEDIINHKIKKEDFEDILKFAEDCLRYLSEK